MSRTITNCSNIAQLNDEVYPSQVKNKHIGSFVVVRCGLLLAFRKLFSSLLQNQWTDYFGPIDRYCMNNPFTYFVVYQLVFRFVLLCIMTVLEITSTVHLFHG